MGRLDDKVVVVTGASRGIGAEIARVFAAEGGKVVCAARTLREGDHPLEGSLDTTVAQIREAGGEATPSTVNISLPEDCERLMQEARDAYGPVDVLVNNAALTYFIPIKDYPLRRWMRSWAVNFHAPFILSQLALEDMVPRGSGSIVNISSGAAHRPRTRSLSRRAGQQRRHLLRRGGRRRSNASPKAWRKRCTSTAFRSPACRPPRSCRRRAPCFTTW